LPPQIPHFRIAPPKKNETKKKGNSFHHSSKPHPKQLHEWNTAKKCKKTLG